MTRIRSALSNMFTTQTLMRGAIIIGIWTIPTLLSALRHYLNATDTSFAISFATQMPVWYPWAILTPLVVEMCRRLNLRSRPWWQTVGKHIAYGLVVCLLYAAISNIGRVWAEGRSVFNPNMLFWTGMLYINTLHVMLLIYAGIVAVVYVVLRGEPVVSPNGGLDKIIIKTSGQLVALDKQDIEWIEAANQYVEINVGETSYLTRGSLKSLERDLSADSFFRIHRSLIVNLKRITHLDANHHGELTLTLNSGKTLRASRSRSQDLKKCLRIAG